MALLEQLIEEQNNIDALPDETITIISELPEEGLDAVWFKDNVPLSMIDAKYETVNKDYTCQLVIPNVTVEDSGDYKIQGGEHESTVSLTVNGSWFNHYLPYHSYFCHFIFLALSIILPQIEQHTDEQAQTDAVSGELSELEKSKALESAQEATQSKESVPLSLVDDINEIIVEDVIPDTVVADVTVEEEGEFGLKSSTSDILIPG